MKTPRFCIGITVAALAAVSFAHWARAGGSAILGTPTKGKPGSAAATNTVKAPLPIPNSVFDVSLKPTKDPFFPDSKRSPFPTTKTKENPGVSAGSFQLTALFGAPPDRLAMINRRTLSVGESADLPFPTGKVKIRLLQIKESSVVLRVVSPPQPDLIELDLADRGAKGTHFYFDPAHPAPQSQ